MKMRYAFLMMVISASIATQTVRPQDDNDADLIGIQYIQGSDEDFTIDNSSLVDKVETEELNKSIDLDS